MTGLKPLATTDEFVARDAPHCPHDDLKLCEGGYIRAWSFKTDGDGHWCAIFGGVADFGDEGDGDYWVECSSCLQRFELPDEWEWD